MFRQWNTGDLESYLVEITAEVLGARRPGPARRSWTSSRTRPSRRAPAAGPCRRRSSWASRSPASPRPCSRGRCPATSTSARRVRPRSVPADVVAKPGRTARRGRAAGAVRVQGRRLRPGLRHDACGSRRTTTGTSTSARWRRSGVAAASSAPGSSTASARPTTTNAGPAVPARRRLLPGRGAAARGTRGAGSSCSAVEAGVPTPGFVSALAYYDGLRSERLPAVAGPGAA